MSGFEEQTMYMATLEGIFASIQGVTSLLGISGQSHRNKFSHRIILGKLDEGLKTITLATEIYLFTVNI